MSIKIKDLRLNILESNLTKGPILKSLIKLAIPIMASSFLATLYNITDMAWIGLLGSKAVAGVGVGGMFTWLSQGLSSIARMGGQVQVAQCIGRVTKKAPINMHRQLCSYPYIWDCFLPFSLWSLYTRW